MKNARGVAVLAIAGCALALSTSTGCSRDVRLADQRVREVIVGPVNLYGISLDQEATPEQVAFAALGAIREDYLAKDKEQREAALDKQFKLCAANVIQKKNHSGMSRDEFVHNVVYRWTPTVAHYVRDFDTEWETAKSRLVRRDLAPLKGATDKISECEIVMQVEDPSGDPAARVVMVVWLAQDSGLWRVTHLGFDRRARSIGD